MKADPAGNTFEAGLVFTVGLRARSRLARRSCRGGRSGQDWRLRRRPSIRVATPLPDHGMTQDPHVIRASWDGWVRNLLGQEPPVDYQPSRPDDPPFDAEREACARPPSFIRVVPPLCAPGPAAACHRGRGDRLPDSGAMDGARDEPRQPHSAPQGQGRDRSPSTGDRDRSV